MRVLLNRRFIFLVLAIAVLLVFPYLYTFPFFDGFLDSFRVFQGMRFALWLIILLGLNLLTGYNGQISLGHAAFVAIGAYIAAILMDDVNIEGDFSMPVVGAVLLGGLITGLIGFLIGIPALRLSGPYLAIATLAVVIVLPQVVKHHLVEEWTGGVMGISLSSPSTPEAIGDRMTRDQWLYYACMVPAIIMTAMAWSLTRSRIGRAFIAIRDSEIGAQQMGVNVSLYKMTAFGLSALYAGTGGALYIFAEGYLGPASFDILLSLTMLVMIVLGGLGSITGSIFAAVIMTMRNDLTDWIAGIIPAGEQIGIEYSRGALFGTLLILSIIFTPRGVAGSIEHMKEAHLGEKLVGLFSRLTFRGPLKGAREKEEI